MGGVIGAHECLTSCKRTLRVLECIVYTETDWEISCVYAYSIFLVCVF